MTKTILKRKRWYTKAEIEEIFIQKNCIRVILLLGVIPPLADLEALIEIKIHVRYVFSIFEIRVAIQIMCQCLEMVLRRCVDRNPDFWIGDY